MHRSEAYLSNCEKPSDFYLEIISFLELPQSRWTVFETSFFLFLYCIIHSPVIISNNSSTFGSLLSCWSNHNFLIFWFLFMIHLDPLVANRVTLPFRVQRLLKPAHLQKTEIQTHLTPESYGHVQNGVPNTSSPSSQVQQNAPFL